MGDDPTISEHVCRTWRPSTRNADSGVNMRFSRRRRRKLAETGEPCTHLGMRAEVAAVKFDYAGAVKFSRTDRLSAQSIPIRDNQRQARDISQEDENQTHETELSILFQCQTNY